MFRSTGLSGIDTLEMIIPKKRSIAERISFRMTVVELTVISDFW